MLREMLRERHFQRNFPDNAIPRDTSRGNISDRKYFFAGRTERKSAPVRHAWRTRKLSPSATRTDFLLRERRIRRLISLLSLFALFWNLVLHPLALFRFPSGGKDILRAKRDGASHRPGIQYLECRVKKKRRYVTYTYVIVNRRN